MPNQWIMLKADDLRFDPDHIISPNWKRFIDYIVAQDIKAGLGIIGASLEEGDERYFDLVKNHHQSGRFEIWNHGYNHHLNRTNEAGETYHEFQNTPYEYQKEHLLKTQVLAREKLDITLRTFGTPGNKRDAHTLRAVDETDEIEVWLYGDDASSKRILKRYANIEFPAHEPDYQKFLKSYDPNREYLLLQGHPNSWDDRRFGQFDLMIQYLKAQGCNFINPYEYHLRNPQ